LIPFVALAVAIAPLVCEATWQDSARGRDLPVRITLPAAGARLPVVVWSPGLGGDRRSGLVWANAWAGAGLAVVQMAHPGSDAAVYRAGDTPEQRRASIVAGASPEQLLARVGDARFVLSELARRPAEGACDLRRIDTDRAAIAGHSMGAWVAQGIAGQRFGVPGGADQPPLRDQPLLRDQRFRAAIALSPTAAPGSTAFRRVGIPFLAITGTLDGTSAAAPPAERAAALAARTAAYESMPADGNKCLLVVAGALHMMFAGNRAAVDTTARHAEAASLDATTAFLTAALGGDAPAPVAPDLRHVLAPGDIYVCK
jgi:predicted dienelactone hydrolase